MIFLAAVKEEFSKLDETQVKVLLWSSLSFFFVLFSYPIIRSTVLSFFIDAVGAKNTPYGWILSIAVLGLVTSLLSRLKANEYPRLSYALLATITIFIFLLSQLFLGLFWKETVYISFVVKEVYIVLLVHSIFGHLNDNLEYQTAKIFYGLIGAIGSLGGLLGGIFTKQMTSYGSTEAIFFIGCLFLLVSAICFLKNPVLTRLEQKDQIDKKYALQSIWNHKYYVGLIGLLVIITQFCVSFSYMDLSIQVEQNFSEKIQMTGYFATLFSWINGISMIVQLIAVPILFKFFSLSTIHMGILASHFLVFLGGSLFLDRFASSSIFFIWLKSIDYSLFSTSKEMLYFALNKIERYGAKYLVDMVIYRTAKGIASVALLIPLVLSFVRIESLIFLFFWGAILYGLFKYRKKRFAI